MLGPFRKRWLTYSLTGRLLIVLTAVLLGSALILALVMNVLSGPGYFGDIATQDHSSETAEWSSSVGTTEWSSSDTETDRITVDVATEQTTAEPSGTTSTPLVTVSQESSTGSSTAAAQQVPEGFVDVATIIQDAVIDCHYASANNFIGRPITGYLANRAFLTGVAAAALKEVADQLARLSEKGILTIKKQRQAAPKATVRYNNSRQEALETGRLRGFCHGIHRRTGSTSGHVIARKHRRNGR